MRIIITISILLLSIPAFSQRYTGTTDGFLIQFWQNKMFYNAAATGYEKKKIIGASGAFIGSKDHEHENYRNALIYYEQPFKQGRSSFGVYSNYHQTVYHTKLSGAASYSYAIPFGNERFLRLGLQAGLRTVDYSDQ